MDEANENQSIIELEELAKKLGTEIEKRFVGNEEKRNLRQLLIVIGKHKTEKLLLHILKKINLADIDGNTPSDIELESMTYGFIQGIKFNPKYPFNPAMQSTFQKFLRVFFKVYSNESGFNTEDLQLMISRTKNLIASIAYNEGEDPGEIESIICFNQISPGKLLGFEGAKQLTQSLPNTEIDNMRTKKEEFYSAIEKRFRVYAEALPVKGDAGFMQHILRTGHVLLIELKNLDIKYNLFGDGQWGYGVNYINDGVSEYANHDVQVINKIDELNKHIKYNLFWLLIFKIENHKFNYHLFCMDLSTGKFNFDSDKFLDLNELENASVRKRDEYFFIDLHFHALTKPFSFQVDKLAGINDKAEEYKRMFDLIINKLQMQVTAVLPNVRPVENNDYKLIIKNGESKTVEFKSTLRWNIKQIKTDKIIEHSVMKTINAFLNCEGGMLFIGLDDDGNLLGLGSDFDSFSGHNKKDEFQKHFDNLIKNGFGNSIHRAIKFTFEEIDGICLALVNIAKKYPEPTFLKHENDEKFYIRATASTHELKGRELANYIKEHWKTS